ncbi:MAG: hypothetical protein JWP50_2277 [Phenylobacterium sp.]|nr:hypothetical protein [Phenylobacterium sp.]
MTTHFTRVALAAVLGASLAGLGGAALAQAGGTKLTTTLNGANEKPTAADPKATGAASVTVNGAQVCYDLQVKDLTQPTMAHIHKGAVDAAGPVAVPLAPPDASGHSTGCVTADPAVAKDIAANPGGYYVNVHSAAFKAGAIRGQLSK